MDGVEEAVQKSDVEVDAEMDADSEYSDAKVSVWWDLKNGDIYNDCDPREMKDIEHTVRSKLNEMNLHGPLSIFCYGDVTQIPGAVQSSFVLDNPIKDYPQDMEDAIYTHIIVEMLKWAKDNPPPATLLLILGDVQISYVTRHLQTWGYTVIFAEGKNLLAGGPPLPNSFDVHLNTAVNVDPFAEYKKFTNAKDLEADSAFGADSE